MVVATLLAALSFWLAQLARTPFEPDMGGFGHEPDFIVEQFQATAFDIGGAPRYRLAADRMTHYMDDDTTALDLPRFSREIPDAPTWRASARRGVVSSNGENVHLLDDVRIERHVTGEAAPMLFSTDYLWVIPEADIVRTDKPIVLRQDGSMLSASGMELDGKRRTLALIGRVKGIYENRQ
jgi:lipopolysaccharide export system protein LptC